MKKTIIAYIYAAFVTAAGAEGTTSISQAIPATNFATAQVNLTAADINVLGVALTIAAHQCGADNQDACKVGLNAGTENAKLTKALQDISDAQAKAAADAVAKNTPKLK